MWRLVEFLMVVVLSGLLGWAARVWTERGGSDRGDAARDNINCQIGASEVWRHVEADTAIIVSGMFFDRCRVAGYVEAARRAREVQQQRRPVCVRPRYGVVNAPRSQRGQA